MAGGILLVAAYGAQNAYMNGNPSMTFFRKVYKTYSHYSMESFTIPMEGPRQLSLQNKIKLRAKIPRNADLLGYTYMRFTLPSIWSPVECLSGNTVVSPYEFQWVNNIGHVIIDDVELTLGGQRLVNFGGDYMTMNMETEITLDKRDLYYRMIGNVPELTAPANGEYSGGITGLGSYPNAVSGTGSAPSIYGRDIIVPLPFWYCNNPGLFLPLGALRYHEIEVTVTLRRILDLYTVLDAPNKIGDTRPQRIKPTADPAYNISKFLSPPGSTTFVTSETETWNLNPVIECTQVFLTDEERRLFSAENHEYLMKQVSRFNLPGITSSVRFNMNQHNLVTRILFGLRRSDLLNRNQWSNFTLWDEEMPPKIEEEVLLCGGQSVPNSGGAIANSRPDILQFARLLFNGDQIFSDKDPYYFSMIQPWQHSSIGPRRGIYLYSFAFNHNTYQPSGSLNASMVKLIELNLIPVAPDTVTVTTVTGSIEMFAYDYEMDIYTESYNFLKIQGGMGGLKYAL